MEHSQSDRGNDAAISASGKAEIQPHAQSNTDTDTAPPPASAEAPTEPNDNEPKDVEMKETAVVAPVLEMPNGQSEAVRPAESTDNIPSREWATVDAAAPSAPNLAAQEGNDAEPSDEKEHTTEIAHPTVGTPCDKSEDNSQPPTMLRDETAERTGALSVTESITAAQDEKGEADQQSQSSATLQSDGGDKADVPAGFDSSMPAARELHDATSDDKDESMRTAEPETMVDDSPYVSSDTDSDSDSSDSDSSSDQTLQEDGQEPDYEMMTVEEQAARLLKEDKEDPEGSLSTKEVKSAHERSDEAITKPDIQITPETKISELGKVETTVDNQAVIKANTTGEYSVLDYGSALCLEDRTIVGAIAETIGQVRQPYYIVLFSNAREITELGIQVGTKIYYVEEHSTSVFTQPLQGMKGSDASNLYDEEVADHEMAFSDDEKEAEFKRQRKEKRKGKGQGDGQMDGFSKPPQGNRSSRRANDRGRGRGHHQSNGMRPHVSSSADTSLSEPLNYDDAPSSELYQPLTRPANLYGGSPAVSSALPPSLPSPVNSVAQPHFAPRGRGQHFNQIQRGLGRGQHPPSQPLPPNPHQNPYPSPYQYQPPQGYPAHLSQQPNANAQPQYPGPQMQGYQPSYNQYQPSYPQYPSFPFQQAYQQPGQPQQQYQQQQPPPQVPNLPPGAHINPNFFRQQPGQGGYGPNYQPR